METKEIKKQEKEPTLTELANSILASLKTTNGQVSAMRSHSVETHLRSVIRELGYQPTETKETRATIAELADQFAACLEAEKGQAAEEKHAHVHSHLKSIASNLKAETNMEKAPALKQVPARKKAPGSNAAGSGVQTPESKGPKADLMAKKYQDLVEIANAINAEPNLAEEAKIKLTPNLKKEDLVTAIMAAKGYSA